MRALLYRMLILLAVIGFIVILPVGTGYASLRKAEAAYLSSDNLQAAEEFRRAANLLPWRPELWDRAGIAHFRGNDYEGAIHLLEIAKEKEVLSDVGWDALGICYFEAGNLDIAAIVWETGLKKYPYYAKYYAHLVYVYHERGNIEAERNALEKWILSDGEPGAPEHYRLGQLLSISDPDRALGEFLLASSLDPKYDSAVETMHTTLNLASLEIDESEKLILVGRGLGLVKEWSLSAEAFRQATATDNENAEAWAWLGEAEQQLGRDGRAELDKALSLERTNPIVRSLSGLYWMRQGNGERALAEYKQAAFYDPDNPAWQISIGDAYVLSGDLQAALISYLRATEIAPTDATVWRLLAGFSTQYNIQVEEIGLPAAQMAVELTGEDPLALEMLGWTLALLERYDEAQDVLEHALSLAPDLPQGYLHLGILLMQTNDWEAAREQIQKARDLDPEGPVGEQARQLLNQYFP